MEYITTLVLVAIVTGLYILWNKTRRLSQWPPGPPTVPFVGNLTIDTKDMISEFRKFRKEYGDVFSLILGSQTVVVVNGLDNLREIFVKHADVVSARPDSFIFRYFNRYRGIAGSSGELWKEHRTLALSTLRDFGFGKRSLEGKISEEVEAFINGVRLTSGKAFSVGDLLHISVSNVVCSVLFGRRYEHDDEKFRKLTQCLSENLNNTTLVGILTFLPFLRYIPGDPIGYSGIMKNVDDIIDHLEDLVGEHKKNLDMNVADNYVDAYLIHQAQNTDPNSTFTDDQLLWSVADLFAAGTETTSTAVKWLLLVLLHKPDIQKRMHDEIKNVVGDSRLPGLADREKLPFTDAVLHETLRFGNIAPNSVPHGLTEDLHLKDYVIPKDAMLIPSLDSVLNDPDIFPNPFEFQPSRFLSEDGTLTGTEKVYTFGLGRRVCLGEALARMELFLFAAALVQKFQFLPPEGATLPSMTEGVLGITRAPLPYDICAVEYV